MTDVTDRLFIILALDISFIAYACLVFFISTRHTYSYHSIWFYLAKASSADHILEVEWKFV